MPVEGLAEPTERRLLHGRDVRLRGFRRKDDLWDIEATLVDRRTYDSRSAGKGQIAAYEPVHHIQVRVTVDDALTVRQVSAAMNAVPYAQSCPAALAPLDALVGASLLRGWRRRIDEVLGGTLGCTHIRDLLAQIATAAFQTIPVWHAQGRGDIIPVVDGKAPSHLGTCTTWAFDGPVVARLYPEFAR